MKIYVKPLDGSGRVFLAESHKEEFQIIAKLKAEGVREIDRQRGDVICDFCSDPTVYWLYTIPGGGEVVQVGQEHHMDADGLWGACNECHALIQARGWAKLGVRSLENYKRIYPEYLIDELILRMSIAHAHAYFASGWDAIGNPDPAKVTPDKDFLGEHGIEPNFDS